VFKSSLIRPIEIEANIPPPGIRLNKKIRNYALKVIQIKENHLIRAKTPINYPPNFQIGLNVDNLNNTNRKFAD